MKNTTLMKAIRLKCLQCTCDNKVEVRECLIKDCTLYPYRMGHRPKEDKKDEIQSNS